MTNINLQPPVFADSSGRRWKKVKLSFFVGSLLLSAIILIGIFSIVSSPILPFSGLAETFKPLKKNQLTKTRLHSPKKFNYGNLAGARLKSFKHRLATTTINRLTDENIVAFYVEWDDTSLTSLKNNLPYIDEVIPAWLVMDSQGNMQETDGAKRQLTADFIKTTKPDTKIIPLINNFNHNVWDKQALSNLLNNQSAQSRLIDQLYNFVTVNNYQGVNLDFEDINKQDLPRYYDFAGALYQKFKSASLSVYLDLPFNNPDFDYQRLGDNCDKLVLMAYDEHWATGQAGPIASQTWFESNWQKRLVDLPPNKYIITLGNYGYDWPDRIAEGNPLSFQEALKISTESEGDINFDGASLNPFYDYYDDHNKLHHVWYLDSGTVYNQMAATIADQPGGYGLWRLGTEDPSVWQIFAQTKKQDQALVTDLQTFTYGYDLDYEGDGEILKVVATPQSGARTFEYDTQDNLITDEKIKAYPHGYVIKRWGDQAKKIALTFDDGPDDTYTQPILNILKQYQAPATFFVIGEKANQYPELLQQEFNNGHEIGIHTFTHPDISQISRRQLTMELNSSQRLLNSDLGISSLLFRPPYAEDVEPETPEQAKPLAETSDLGYYTIGMKIDPGDWRPTTAQTIIDKVLTDAKNNVGHVVLLHDGGGNRQATVDALPQLITALRADGWQIASVSDLAGLTKDKTNPPLSGRDQLYYYGDSLFFAFINFIIWLMYYLLLIGVGLGLLRLLIVVGLAPIQKRRRNKLTFDKNFAPLVTVIIPAYNEAKVINKTIASVINSVYKHLEILVVDDGSTDLTYQTAEKAWSNNPAVKIFSQANQGKAVAINHALSEAAGEIIIVLDADTVFDTETIFHLVKHFQDERVGAVAGNAKVGNRRNLLTYCQALEYITGQNIDRRAFEVLNCITVVPGAVGAWRKTLITAAGGFTADTLAEDADLTMKAIEDGYRIIYEDQAIAYTEAPEKLAGFLTQRFRWMYGTFQSAWKHSRSLFRPRYKFFGFFALPYIFIFQILLPLISPIADLMVVVSFALFYLDKLQHPLEYNNSSLIHVLYYYAIFLLIELATAFLAFWLEPKEDRRLIALIFIQRFFYRQLMYFIALKTTVLAIKGKIMGWGKLTRTNNVKIKAS